MTIFKKQILLLILVLSSILKKGFHVINNGNCEDQVNILHILYILLLFSLWKQAHLYLWYRGARSQSGSKESARRNNLIYEVYPGI